MVVLIYRFRKGQRTVNLVNCEVAIALNLVKSCLGINSCTHALDWVVSLFKQELFYLPCILIAQLQ